MTRFVFLLRLTTAGPTGAIFLAQCTFLVLSLCGQSVSLAALPSDAIDTDQTAIIWSEEEAQWIADHPVIKLGVDRAWLPIEFVTDDGQYQGISSEYMGHLQGVLGVEFSVQTGLSWEQVMTAVEVGELDLLPAVARTAGREAFLNFTEPYLSLPLVIFTRNQAAYVNGLDDLSGRRVAVERGYLAHELLLANHPLLTLVEKDDSESALRAVAEGNADAYVGNLMVASYIIGERGFTNLKVAAPTHYDYELSIGVRKDWPELIPLLQRALDSLTAAQKAATQQKWVSVQYDVDVDYQLLWQVLAAALLILLVGSLWLLQVRKQREELRVSEERFQFAMAASDGIWDWDIVTGEVHFSPRYFTMLGYQPGELRENQSTLQSLLHPDDREAVLALVEQAVKACASDYEQQFRLKCKDGSYRTIQSRGHVVADDGQGNALRAVGVHTDVTERVIAENKLQVFQRFAETSGQGFAIGRLSGGLTYANETLWRLVGETSAEAFCAGDYDRFFTESLREKFAGKTGAELEQQRQWTGELTLVSRQGEKIPVLLNFFLLRDQYGKSAFLGAVVTDIRDQKLTEQALEEARHLAERANQYKSEFLANMSHEIRTPLNAITGMAYLVRQTDLTPQQRDYLDKLDYSSKALLGVVNDILDFSKIEAGRLHMEQTPFLLDDLFGGLGSIAWRRAGDSVVEMIYDIDPNAPKTLIGDPLRLGQVLTNLTQNALKFTEQGQILVAVELLNQSADQVELQFSIRDTGIGIEADRLGVLFEPFGQADGSTTRQYGGSGLGLAICKRLVTMMDGNIWVESEPDIGSTFYFTALFKPGSMGIETPPQPPAGLRDLRILLADDNATVRQALVKMLELYSFRVTLVSSGSAAVAELERVSVEEQDDPYKLAILDSVMPGLSGTEACQLIHQSEEAPHLPVIIMFTADYQSEMMSNAAEAGAEGLLVKPVTPSSLFRAVISTLNPDKGTETPDLLASVNVDPPDLSGLRVLIAEDNRINQQVARELLENAGATVEIAGNGAEAVNRLIVDDYGLVLMDMQMPDMDGYQATRMIRKQARHSNLPIIAMTAHALRGDRERCLAAGMNDYLAKPVDPKEFYEVMGKWGGRTGDLLALSGDRQVLKNPLSTSCDEFASLDSESVDYRVGLQRIGGNRQLYGTLLGDLLTDHGGDGEQIRQAMENRDYEWLNRLVHTLQGTAGNLGALRLEQLAEAFSATVMAGAPDGDLFAQFENELNCVLTAIDQWLAQNGDRVEDAGGELTMDLLEQQRAICQLDRLLAEHNGGAGKQWRVCRDFLVSRLSTEQLEQLEHQIADYDFDSALVTLRQAGADASSFLENIRE